MVNGQWSCLLKHPPPQTSGSSLQNECQPALFSVSAQVLPPLPTHSSATAQQDAMKDQKGNKRAPLTFNFSPDKHSYSLVSCTGLFILEGWRWIYSQATLYRERLGEDPGREAMGIQA